MLNGVVWPVGARAVTVCGISWFTVVHLAPDFTGRESPESLGGPEVPVSNLFSSVMEPAGTTATRREAVLR